MVGTLFLDFKHRFIYDDTLFTASCLTIISYIWSW